MILEILQAQFDLILAFDTFISKKKSTEIVIVLKYFIIDVKFISTYC